jgi:hypothetical protein
MLEKASGQFFEGTAVVFLDLGHVVLKLQELFLHGFL